MEQGNIRPTIGVALVLFGTAKLLTALCRGLYDWLRRKRACTTVNAEVLDVSASAAPRNLFGTSKGEEQRYLPKLRYEADGKTYEVFGQESKRENWYVVGQTLTVRYRPDRPQTVVSRDPAEERSDLLQGCVYGVLAIGVGALLMYL